MSQYCSYFARNPHRGNKILYLVRHILPRGVAAIIRLWASPCAYSEGGRPLLGSVIQIKVNALSSFPRKCHDERIVVCQNMVL